MHLTRTVIRMKINAFPLRAVYSNVYVRLSLRGVTAMNNSRLLAFNVRIHCYDYS